MSRYIVDIEGTSVEVQLLNENGKQWAILGENRYAVKLLLEGDEQYTLVLGNRQYPIALSQNGKGYELYSQGRSLGVLVERATVRALREHLRSSELGGVGAGMIEAHMPGLIVKIHVEAGQQVEVGDPLLVIEAMKMENEIRAPIRGIVKSVAVSEGSEVSGGATLCILEAE